MSSQDEQSATEETQEPIPTDYDIAQSTEMEPIWELVEPWGLGLDDLQYFGEYTAKVKQHAIERLREQAEDKEQNLVLVTGMTPTPKGEGKTVTTVGLGQTLNHVGEEAMIAIREPSLGPVFGVKGGAAGGGRSQVLPMEDINLHFTGDLHALTSAHNLIAAMLDAKISQGDDLNIDINNVSWPRAIDMNDRALRETVVGLGGKTGGTPREDSFLLTAASELMAVLCLASDLGDLKERVSRIIVAYDEDGDPVTVEDIEATGPATMLLRDAIKPNVVQTIEGTPALVHGGPFANIAHGTNSLVADKTAFGMGDYLVTEAGFGSDLGAEKFMDVVCRKGDMTPNAVVLVASVRALKYHGLDQWPVDYDEIDEAGVEAVEAGFSNLDKHATNLQKFGVPVVVSVNRFPDDTDEEIQAILDHCREDLGVRAAESNVFSDGSEGGVDLAENVIEATEESNEEDFRMLYDDEDSIKEKIHTVATEIYGADDVKYTGGALDDIEQMNELDFDDYPVVMSKTFHSLSDDASQKGAPEGWELEISEVYPSAGAGFLVALTADALTMPGLPARPAAADMDIDEDGNISGLF
ncbi:formate--tetrahydrofolate ligase (plasmid) [Haloarcula hispanica N601]|uniref:Formate--tetrahydrofolate ligase n=3 Tax=Haloarcula hispanica TaxID=51589 RepID=V5TU00_HALHI|nr:MULTISPECIES: formate--tetrahydrofolate ligase [Haloarcula]AEM59320.1 formyltetrahydrofolate synthetase [Haloarcula hispanica ATCC 33960]AHB68175.1 formate--tetrahydrofolate ligase [Haloarcula hispanica N601]AJF27504.1 formate--tetrahydrofolate ligase [Haloarcula sp. CBA1115]KAA9404226.1 formate--tetrahydrofolate ligase [Haloarcula sp. CBA1131]KAA9405098.1 formate--tetrahydrofolate ligase [Haloarcula hispanica]